MKFTGNGIDAFLQKVTDDGGTPPTPAAITNLTNAKPAIVTVDDIGDIVTGNLVQVAGTGRIEVDGKTFKVGSITTDSFPLEGSDLSGAPAPLTVGTVTPLSTDDMLQACFRQFERTVEAADAIDVTTFCGTESLAGTPTPGTISFEAFMDFDQAWQDEWRAGLKDGVRRILQLNMPQSGPSIIYTITPSGLTESFEVGEASTFDGEAVLNEEPLIIR